MYLKTTNLIGFRHIYEIVFIESNKNHYAIYPTLRYGYYQKPQGEIQNETSSFFLEKIEENLFDPSATANQISGIINVLQAIQFVSESWREVSCSTIRNCFAHYGFSNFIGPQPELTELDEQFLFVQNHNEF
ncbi:unnamed protein product [Macrosiphum euphorbiae]|uniref:DDE-1 domain-containing protein n=1 Tax=Macrosiphum euphorbiae TaxID=13131 RepID=A0AAV0X3C8_9HEMI|nr:unnamed protein product [Macrosiphum euphorbiae]